MMEIFKYALLGLIQGFTEPIPISSSGHLVIFQYLFGITIEGLSFEVLVNFASLLAILLIYRSDLLRMSVNSWRYLSKQEGAEKTDFWFVIYLLVATIPAAIIGLLFADAIAATFKDSISTIGITLIITGIALWLIRNLKGKKSESSLRLRDAVIIGLAQAVALIPGISRSGATIVAAMGLGIKQETALRFSFFLFIPVSAGTMLMTSKQLIEDPLFFELLLPYATAFLAALAASYFSLKWFIGIMARGNLKWFSYYCFAAGISLLVFLS